MRDCCCCLVSLFHSSPFVCCGLFGPKGLVKEETRNAELVAVFAAVRRCHLVLAMRKSKNFFVVHQPAGHNRLPARLLQL